MTGEALQSTMGAFHVPIFGLAMTRKPCGLYQKRIWQTVKSPPIGKATVMKWIAKTMDFEQQQESRKRFQAVEEMKPKTEKGAASYDFSDIAMRKSRRF